MSNWIINTPYHKRWWLPDRQHYLNSVMFGDELQLSVWHDRTMTKKESITFKIDNDQWENWSEQFQRLAYKKHMPDVIRRRRMGLRIEDLTAEKFIHELVRPR